MKKYQIDQYDMLLAVENHFDDNIALWTGNAPVSASKTLLSSKIDTLAAHVATQLINTTGITIDKDDARYALEALALSLSAAMSGYAAAAGNDDLYNRCNYTKTALGEFRDAELLGICSILHGDATAHLASMASHGVTAAVLTTFLAAHTAFGAIMRNPSGAIAKRIEATALIAILLPDILNNVLARRLDNDVIMLTAAQPSFVNIYSILRNITDSPTSTMSATITALSQGSNLPLPNVDIEITGQNIHRTTSQHGYTNIINLTSGTHQLVASHPAYIQQTINFIVVSGETTEIVLLMVPIPTPE